MEENHRKAIEKLGGGGEGEGEEEQFSDSEKTPSLSDLPLAASTPAANAAGIHHDHRRSSSEPADFFEFITHVNNGLNPRSSSKDPVFVPSFADDLFFCGQLRPLHPFPPHHDHPPPPVPLHLSPISSTQIIQNIRPRLRSESLKESSVATTTPRSHLLQHYSPSSSLPCFGPSRSLDYRRLRRGDRSSSIASSCRNPDFDFRGKSSDCGGRSGRGAATRSSPPWYSLVFGPVGFPTAEIEMMTRRRRGRSVNSSRPVRPLLSAGEGGKVPGYRSGGWKLISVLSCKSHGSVAVTAPFRSY